ncbi:hypothetical protein K470DRAFT_258321 [Piedraia hortae CBS 480.64]|uniref:Na+/H+ antiporter n=1 Tax=Piedraia hortae CBS 480.64 TaxID=1314780 RepID=A0A6A7BX84_9PEZI|nr:hypothetical protein K470DRAFT_258321 [Piedraia hortae CBS 480.64]
MAWEHLEINRPHLVYIILGGFTSLFMLCSSVIKERLYIGEATVATICGIIFGPHAANLVNPGTWGNTDQVTLELSRIVLVVQCFAVGVELPRAYMEKHVRSVTFLLIPVMIWGWLITSLFIWGLFHASLAYIDCLVIAACVTATDPVLASSVVGKGKFAKRVPRHLRDLLSAESGCNDGMAFPFIYLALYLIRYKAGKAIGTWVCMTILYECLFGAIYGVAVGYIARRAFRYAHEKDWMDRESFLVFYFVLALFCAGSGSILGLDDLLVGFACGVGFSNDGWFTEKTEESHVSNVIDLLINLAFFVYFGTIIPWAQFNAGFLGLEVWRLVVLAILVLLFRRIPIMMMLKPVIPDIKTWREALFAGHFGPIGVGAIFVAILARGELEHEETTPLAVMPEPPFPHLNIIELIWPITTFLVICSIVVHGSSVAVFTLGKHINTLTLTMTYTQGNEVAPTWTDRLPRIQSRSKTMSMNRSDSEYDEKDQNTNGPSTLPPIGIPGAFLRRQREGESPLPAASRHRSRRSRKWESGEGPGGPITPSAIGPAPRLDNEEQAGGSGPDSPGGEAAAVEAGEGNVTPAEIYEEGHKTVYEDKEGEVLAVEDTRSGEFPGGAAKREETEMVEAQRLASAEKDADHEATGGKAKDTTGAKDAQAPKARPGRNWRGGFQKFGSMGNIMKHEEPKEPKDLGRGPAQAYRYGNTVILEDENGEVIRKFDITSPNSGKEAAPGHQAWGMAQLSKMLGVGEGSRPSSNRKNQKAKLEEENDQNMRFTIGSDGKHMRKDEFVEHIRHMDPKTRANTVERSNAPESVKRQARAHAREYAAAITRRKSSITQVSRPADKQASSSAARPSGEAETVGYEDAVPTYDLGANVRKAQNNSGSETAAERRRRQAAQRQVGNDRAPETAGEGDATETAAERRRREGALGLRQDENSDSEEDDQPRQKQAIRFADQPRPTERSDRTTLKWGKDVRS